MKLKEFISWIWNDFDNPKWFWFLWIILLALMLGGCDKPRCIVNYDEHRVDCIGDVEIKTIWNPKITGEPLQSVANAIAYRYGVIPEGEEPIGEAFVEVNKCSGPFCHRVKEWLPFTEVQDEHCLTDIPDPCVKDGSPPRKCADMCWVKINGSWVDKDKTFLYSDIDIYENRRKEIEND